MNFTVTNIESADVFLDDKRIITKRTVKDHETVGIKHNFKKLDKEHKKIDKENIAIKLNKCEFVVTEIVRLGYQRNPVEITPIVRETDSMMKMDERKTLKQLRSFTGSIHQLQKFTQNISQLSAPLLTLL